MVTAHKAVVHDVKAVFSCLDKAIEFISSFSVGVRNRPEKHSGMAGKLRTIIIS